MLKNPINNVLAHIQNWRKVWFGLIFLGSIFNAIAEQSNYLNSMFNVSFWSFSLGALMGLIAKNRGRWL